MLLGHHSAERAIRAVVRWYLRWVCDNPAMASYLLNHRHAEYLVDAQSSLEDLNVELRNEVRGWIEQRIETGELPAMQLEMYWAVVLGPSELLCRQTLREARAEQIQASARLLEDATWGAIRSML